MKCVRHNGLDAVSACMWCWSGLCPECLGIFKAPTCKQCWLKVNQAELETLESEMGSNQVVGTILAIVVLGVFAYMFVNKPIDWLQNWAGGVLVMVFFCACAFFTPYGWSFINWLKDKNTVTVKVNENLIALLLRKYFKFWIAWMIGIFVWPRRIRKTKERIAELKKDIQEINQLM